MKFLKRLRKQTPPSLIIRETRGPRTPYEELLLQNGITPSHLPPPPSPPPPPPAGFQRVGTPAFPTPTNVARYEPTPGERVRFTTVLGNAHVGTYIGNGTSVGGRIMNRDYYVVRVEDDTPESKRLYSAFEVWPVDPQPDTASMVADLKQIIEDLK